MNNRNYNVFFHLHTVSGIIISVGLYIVFFAGAFALFMKPIGKWELDMTDPHVPTRSFSSINYDRLVDSLEVKGYPMYGRYIYIYFRPRERLLDVYLGESADSLASKDKKESQQLKLDTENYTLTKATENEDDHFTIAGLLYSLHFFEQLGEFGLYLSGGLGLMLLFAMVSGILVHWKKIISNFYIFRPKEKLKTVWTDAHTALGIIGIPYQLMYAVTGAMFGISILIGLSGSVLYGGDHEKLEEAIYASGTDYKLGKPVEKAYSLNVIAKDVDRRRPDFKPIYIQIFNLGSSNTLFDMYGESDETTGFPIGGAILYNVITGKVIKENAPFDYADSIQPIFAQLHFGRLFKFNELGLYLVKAFYFLLAIATCFVIITGVLIWLEARNKKNIPHKERRFNETTGHIYLAICLTMFPVTAFSLLVSKLLPDQLGSRTLILNSVFFGSWFVLSLFFWFKRSNSFTNTYTLFAGGLLGLLIPVVNGLKGGSWFWRTLWRQQHEVFITDMLWLTISCLSLYAVYRISFRPGGL